MSGIGFFLVNSRRKEDWRFLVCSRQISMKENFEVIFNSFEGIREAERLHSVNVSYICEKIARELGLPESEVANVKLAGLLHDVGKSTVQNSILDNPGKLNNTEWAVMQNHTESGYRILMAHVNYSDFARCSLEHHERWDGKGYPYGLKGEEISLYARIVSIADSFDVMMTARPYKKPYTLEKAMNEIRANAGTQFDPYISKVFLEHVLKKYATG